MKNEELTTSDFLATGEHRETDTPAPGVGGARMVKEPAPAPLFSDAESQEFRGRWDQIQIAFVDEPQRSVHDADTLVAETMKRLAEVFSDERKKMEDQWSKGGDVSTEDLRVALQRYRSFFNRLLSV